MLKAKTNVTVVVVLITAALVASIITSALESILGITDQNRVFAQGGNASSLSVISTNETRSNVTGTTTTTIPTLTRPGEKEFYLFTAEVEDLNETKLGIKADVFTLPIMEVNNGDNVTVHFYNLEKEGGDRHSFTIGEPYNIDKDLGPGENGIISFKADHEGIFQYYCKYHEPAMTGQLMVSP